MHNDSSVRELAYRLWEAHGRPQGTAERDWLEAERQLSEEMARVDQSLRDTFPASDPPSSHIPDAPPANAEAKWAAASAPRRAARKSGTARSASRRTSPNADLQ